MKNKLIFEENVSIRLDVFLTKHLQNITRSYIKTLIDSGKIFVNGKIVKAGYMLKCADVVDFEIPECEQLDAKPEKIDFEIVYEDKDLLVINKPQGLVVHPCATTKSGTLVNGLLERVKDLSGINGILRPGIVHRLDKDTSGLMVVAKNDFAHKNLAEQLKDKTLCREYYALIKGVVKANFDVEGYLSRNAKDRKQMSLSNDHTGKYSLTHFEIVKIFNKGYTLLNCILSTGRTHQIRAHLKSKHLSIVGDKLYGNADKKLNGQLLHAHKLAFVHPRTLQKMEFECNLPDYYKIFLDKLQS